MFELAIVACLNGDPTKCVEDHFVLNEMVTNVQACQRVSIPALVEWQQTNPKRKPMRWWCVAPAVKERNA